MKILFLSLRFPYPPNRGDRIRAYNFIKHLSKDHAITLISFAHSKEDFDNIAHLEKYCHSIRVVSFKPLEAYVSLGKRFFSKAPLQVSYFSSRRMQKEVEAAVCKGDFDLLHVHFFRLAPYVLPFNSVPKFLDLCDSFSINLQRRARLDRSLFWPLLKLEEKRVRRYETDIVQRFDLTAMVSELEKNYMLSLRQERQDLNLCVIPLGVDLEYFKPAFDGDHRYQEDDSTLRPRGLKNSTSDPKIENQLLFTGTMNYFPNCDAVCHFYKQIFPFIRANLPNIRFYIVGHQPSKKMWQLAKDKAVVVTGKVADVRPYFRKASVFVCPLRAGSGVQAKILEAMAMGTPVVTTSIGLEGIEAIPDRDLLVADEPEEFAQKTLELIRDAQFRQKIAQNARKLVESRYSWDSVVNLLNAAYEKIIK